MVDEHDTRVWRVLQYYVAKAGELAAEWPAPAVGPVEVNQNLVRQVQEMREEIRKLREKVAAQARLIDSLERRGSDRPAE